MSRALVLACSALMLAGCFTTTGDFKENAEEFIVENEDLAEAIGVGFTSATCQEPANRDVGTTFLCSATDDLGRTWEFSIEITGSNEYVVNESRRP